MEVLVEHLGGVQFEVKARVHSIITDQPLESGSWDEGMTPPELFLASLGSCAGFYAAQYLRKHHLSREGTRIRVTAEKAQDPARLAEIRIEVDVPVVLSPEHHDGIERAVHNCLIHNTLVHPPQMAIAVVSAETALRL